MKKKTKKSQEITPLFFIVIAIFCFSSLILLYNKYNQYSETIGFNSFKLMQIYEESEKFYFLVSEFIKREFFNNFNNELEKSFSDCKEEYYGYKIINENCKVDINNIKKINSENIKKNFEKILQPYPAFDFYLINDLPKIKTEQDKILLIAMQVNNLVAEINTEKKGKCCFISKGYSMSYFSVKDDCSEVRKYLNLNDDYIINETDSEYCKNELDISLKYEDEIFKKLESENIQKENKKENKVLTQDIKEEKNNFCSYCGSNRNLVKTYFGNKYPECEKNVCCSAPCPPGTKKLNFPFYAQCDFSGYAGAACFAGCGPTSLKMVLDGYHNTNYDLFYIWKGIGVIGKPTYTTRISNYANRLKNLKAYCTSEISFESIKKFVDSGKATIVLVHMPQYNKETARTLSNAWHFFLIVGYANNEIIVHEPYPSPAAYSSLRKYGKYLVITKNTYQNNIYPSSLSYGETCAGNVIYKEI